ncbi:hypothetical protein [Sphingopyxis alaskensis]|jgi:hypothetical protein|uniref:Uncharacterized protein n=1 Tax=Sphingopyxis alaskensis (strain DSM 13593 / LMG 18877 / RB2256) TaxID=317655 RepID=Q1GRG8_SPHAL|nr:hypothetical protein [Sphingopyxis alaskensis]ABF53754.1 conserved hypothetical protein [Sphingopyxis alaskensis RB2256]MCM3419431.1 hypothetical protein [Sphingopyxis alaskensis]
MTTDFSPRLFERDSDIRALGEGLLACALPRAAWTHEAHLAACLWLLTERPDIDIDAEIAGLIRRFNESVGGVNDDHNGYHDSITRAYVAGVRRFLSETAETALMARVNALLLSDVGRRDWPLRFYSRERLFSVAARRGFVEPDLAPLPRIVIASLRSQ